MTEQNDLFGPALLPGLSYAAEIVTPEEEAALLGEVGAIPLLPFRFQGWTGKRLTASFGWRYDFEDATFAPTDPIPDFLLPLRAKAAVFAGLREEDLIQMLLVRYDPGAGIGWHRDRPVFEHVVGISLAAAATIRFRRRNGAGFDRFALPAPPRSAYHLAEESRWSWEHSIAPMEETRWSITFRTLSEKGLALQRRISAA